MTEVWTVLGRLCNILEMGSIALTPPQEGIVIDSVDEMNDDEIIFVSDCTHFLYTEQDDVETYRYDFLQGHFEQSYAGYIQQLLTAASAHNKHIFETLPSTYPAQREEDPWLAIDPQELRSLYRLTEACLVHFVFISLALKYTASSHPANVQISGISYPFRQFFNIARSEDSKGFFLEKFKDFRRLDGERSRACKSRRINQAIAFRELLDTLKDIRVVQLRIA